MIYLTEPMRCTLCFQTQKRPVHDDSVCLACRPAIYDWPGTVAISDLMPLERAKETHAHLDSLPDLSPAQLRVYLALDHGKAREDDREAFVAARDWALPEAAGNWFGVVGERYRGVLLYTDKVVELGLGDYGMRYLARMNAADPDTGAVCDLTWFSGEGMWVTVGAEEVGDFTVKSHETYQGSRQTLVNRVMKPRGKK